MKILKIFFKFNKDIIDLSKITKEQNPEKVKVELTNQQIALLLILAQNGIKDIKDFDEFIFIKKSKIFPQHYD